MEVIMRGIRNIFNTTITKAIDALESIQEQTVENKVGRFIIQEINGNQKTIYLIDAFGRAYGVQKPENLRIKPEIVGGDLTIHKYHLVFGDYSIMNAPSLTSLIEDITNSTLRRDEVVASEINLALKTCTQF